MKNKTIVVFDLDDTLCKEIDYLKSAYREISMHIAKDTDKYSNQVFNDMLNFYQDKLNVFENILNKYQSTLTVNDLLSTYRNHFPDINLSKDTISVLDYLKNNSIEMGLITDGRSVQQRNKIKALGIEHYFSEIIISEEFGSEKPNLRNFQYFENRFGKAHYYYIGDNIKKDFIAPNSLKWSTVCLLDNGLNIHKAPIALKNSAEHQAKFNIQSLPELLNLIKF